MYFHNVFSRFIAGTFIKCSFGYNLLTETQLLERTTAILFNIHVIYINTKITWFHPVENVNNETKDITD